MTDAWIDRVKAADAEAERRYRELEILDEDQIADAVFFCLIAIAAELRAQRIAQRPAR